MNDANAGFSFGSTESLYVEYMKRSDPFTMTDDHYHSYYEVYYLLSGRRVYFVRDRTYEVEQGDLVLIGKHELHKTMQSGSEPHERAILHFTEEFIRSAAGRQAELLLHPFAAGGSHVIRLPRPQQMEADAAIRAMLREIREREPGFELPVRQYALALMLAAGRYVRRYGPVPFRHATPLHAKISEITRYINDNFQQPLRLTDLSDTFYISPHYLSRMFKEVTGFAFSDYVTLTRIKEAQRLLRETERSVSDIAEAVGYDNFSHFGKTFKRLTRQSPREYRKSSLSV